MFGFRDLYVGDSGGIVPQCGSVLKELIVDPAALDGECPE